jgi:membrane-associated phospholipid phosphatase
MKNWNLCARVGLIVCLAILFRCSGYAQAGNRFWDRPTGKAVGIIIPSVLITYGAISLGNNGFRKLDYTVRDRLTAGNAGWKTYWEDYLQFAPGAAAFGMKAGGVESVHGARDMIFLYALSNAINTGLVHGAKHWVSRERPDFSNHRSFPSGHTALAFASAEFIRQEYRDQSVWISVGGYAMATFVGAARVYNNQHWVSDVAAGAGIGILSTKIAYWSYPYLKKVFNKKTGKTNLVCLPGYGNRTWGLSFACSF